MHKKIFNFIIIVFAICLLFVVLYVRSDKHDVGVVTGNTSKTWSDASNNSVSVDEVTGYNFSNTQGEIITEPTAFDAPLPTIADLSNPDNWVFIEGFYTDGYSNYISFSLYNSEPELLERIVTRPDFQKVESCYTYKDSLAWVREISEEEYQLLMDSESDIIISDYLSLGNNDPRLCQNIEDSVVE